MLVLCQPAAIINFFLYFSYDSIESESADVAVFSGNIAASSSSGSIAISRDHMYEQITPNMYSGMLTCHHVLYYSYSMYYSSVTTWHV